MTDGGQTSAERRLLEDTRTPRAEWPARFRRVVEYFEATEDPESFKSGGAYPDEADPYVLHARHLAPLHADDEKDRPWNILLNPWPGREREAWIMDGRPVLPSETVHGAADPENDLIANDRDLVRIGPHQVAVCVELTQVAQMHTRAGNWILSDDRVEDQFDTVLDGLEAAPDGGRDE